LVVLLIAYYSAEVYADGTVVYHGEACVKVMGERRHKITPDRVAQLVKAFEQVNYFSLKDAHEVDEHGLSYTDLARTTTSISMNGKYKKVVDYLCPPKELVALEDLIDKLAGLYDRPAVITQTLNKPWDRSGGSVSHNFPSVQH